MYELYDFDFIDTEIEQCILPATQRKNILLWKVKFYYRFLRPRMYERAPLTSISNFNYNLMFGNRIKLQVMFIKK